VWLEFSFVRRAVTHHVHGIRRERQQVAGPESAKQSLLHAALGDHGTKMVHAGIPWLGVGARLQEHSVRLLARLEHVERVEKRILHRREEDGQADELSE